VSEFLYTPSEWQQRYHTLNVDEALGAGAVGPGKSICLLMNPVQKLRIEHARMMRDPRTITTDEGSRLFQLIVNNPIRKGYSLGWALHLRRTVPMLKQTLSRAARIFPAIDPDVHYKVDDNTYTFSSGYRIQFGHCSDLDSWQNYQSNEYDEIDWDELVQFTEEQYDQISTRLRSSDPVLMHMLYNRSMSNPMLTRAKSENFSVHDPFWVRKRFVEPAPEGGVILRTKIRRSDGTDDYKTRIYLPARLSDNPDKEFVRQYERQLLDKKPHIRKALMDGDWYVSAGAFFAEAWDPMLHVCRPFHVPLDWPQFRAMDWGFKTSGVVLWFAIDPDHNLWCHRELTFKGKDATHVAEDVRDIEKGMGLWDKRKDRSKLLGPADTQLWEERGERGKSKAEEMADVGVFWTRADKKSRVRNAERVLQRLNDHHEGTVTPGLMVFQNCRMLIRTLPGIQSDPGNPEEPMKGGEDHHYDTLSYGVAYASRPGVGRSADDDEDDDGLEHDVADRGELGYG
jgi:phage terminase large subunit